MTTAELELLAAVEETARPWAPFIGLVDLCVSRYCASLCFYKITFADRGHTVVLHPDDLEAVRRPLVERYQKTVSDAELAAYVWWRASN